MTLLIRISQMIFKKMLNHILKMAKIEIKINMDNVLSLMQKPLLLRLNLIILLKIMQSDLILTQSKYQFYQ
jgi:hypothetical protein